MNIFHNKSKLVVILISILITTLVILFVMSRNQGHDLSQKNSQWQQKYPKLLNNAGYAKLISGNSMYKQKRDESEISLEGRITNAFGVRDDILDYILKTVPSNNESAIRAAIKLAQEDQLIYYGDISESEALRLDSNENLIETCLATYLPNNNQGLQLMSKMDKLMRNTKLRDKHMWDIDRKYFGWRVLSSGLNSADEDKACAEGLF